MKLASPMYILRDIARQDLPGTLARLKGYDGVEFLDFFGYSAKDVRKMCDDNGLTVCSSHVPAGDILRDSDRVLDYHEELGCRDIIAAGLDTRDMPGALSVLRQVMDIAGKRGFRVHYHNHGWELTEKYGYSCVLEAILDNTDVLFECDAGWIEIAGGSADSYMTIYRDRIRILHMKDYYAGDRGLIGDVRDLNGEKGGPGRGDFAFRPTGWGIMNYPARMPLIREIDPEWVVPDHDASYGRDPIAELNESAAYVRELFELK